MLTINLLYEKINFRKIAGNWITALSLELKWPEIPSSRTSRKQKKGSKNNLKTFIYK